jgi:SAM-dependent methyltransferase
MSGDPDLRNVNSSGHHERIMPDDIPEEPYHIARYAFAVHWAPGRRVADLGCGVGYGANLLAAAGATRVWAVDVNPQVIQYAQARYGSAALTFVCADVAHPLQLPLVDMVTCFEVIEHVDRPMDLIRNVAHVLAPNGVALFSTPNAVAYGGYSGNPYHVKEYTRTEFVDLLRKSFGELELLFQWPFGDAFDAHQDIAFWARAVIPVTLKHWLRRGKTGNAQHSTSPWGAAVRCRPTGVQHLVLPGLKYSEPIVWVAVCRSPLAS